MPSRNTFKPDVAEAFYHVYARGASKQPIFLESADFEYFINLFARYLSGSPQTNKAGIPYPHFRGQIELLAYCLMSNHFHLLIYQTKSGAMTNLMRSIMTSYSRYFNLKYKRTGSLFESRYKASLITTPSYVEHISRYIHLNPRYWQRYLYSSIEYYKTDISPEWLQNQKILDMFASKTEYLSFLKDYQDHKNTLDEIKHELAES